MHQAAIYVRDALGTYPSIISKEDQETICRDYCSSTGLSVTATFADEAGASDQFDRMMRPGHQPRSPLRRHRGLEAPPLLNLPRGDHRVPGQAPADPHQVTLRHRAKRPRLTGHNRLRTRVPKPATPAPPSHATIDRAHPFHQEVPIL